MKKVLINVSFKDRYTGKTHVAGKTEEMSEERIAEVKEVNPHFISVVGNVEKKDTSDEKDDKGESDKKGGKDKSAEK